MTYKVVGFLAREHGINGLKSLIDSTNYSLICVFTHSLNPKVQNYSPRKEFKDYKSLCKNHNISLYAVDSKEDAREIGGILDNLNGLDFIVSISWRRLIPVNQLNMPKYGGINLHRGKLPDYAGAEPIKRALNNKDKFIYVTSHILAEEIDSGNTISVYKHIVNYNNRQSLDENIERLKKEITPCFGQLLIDSLDVMVDNYGK